MSVEVIIRKDVVDRLIQSGKWSLESATLGERAGYRCEYCDLDLLASVENFKLWERDHIVPICRDGDPDDIENLAVACRICNWCIKADWNPRIQSGHDATRTELVLAVREYIARRKAELGEELAIIREIVGDRTNRIELTQLPG